MVDIEQLKNWVIIKKLDQISDLFQIEHDGFFSN